MKRTTGALLTSGPWGSFVFPLAFCRIREYDSGRGRLALSPEAMTQLTTYDRLTVEGFGKRLLGSLDLDPIYVALVRMQLTLEELGRWLLAYWCCYDAGVSSYIADAEDPDEFWGRMGAMAANEVVSPLGGRWRRAAERRHWRGKNAAASYPDFKVGIREDAERDAAS